MNERSQEQEVNTIVAEVAGTEPEALEQVAEPTTDPRIDDLDRRIRELESAMGDLRTVSASASAQASAAAGRKTQASYAPRLLAKGAEPVREGGVDAALSSLSVEQRIAVKAGLLRAGLL